MPKITETGAEAMAAKPKVTAPVIQATRATPKKGTKANKAKNDHTMVTEAAITTGPKKVLEPPRRPLEKKSKKRRSAFSLPVRRLQFAKTFHPHDA